MVALLNYREDGTTPYFTLWARQLCPTLCGLTCFATVGGMVSKR